MNYLYCPSKNIHTSHVVWSMDYNINSITITALNDVAAIELHKLIQIPNKYFVCYSSWAGGFFYVKLYNPFATERTNIPTKRNVYLRYEFLFMGQVMEWIL